MFSINEVTNNCYITKCCCNSNKIIFHFPEVKYSIAKDHRKISLTLTALALSAEVKTMCSILLHKHSVLKGRHLPVRQICLRNPGWTALAARPSS